MLSAMHKTNPGVRGAVYAPPNPDFPILAVLFDPEGYVYVSSIVGSPEEGARWIEATMPEAIDLWFKERRPNA